MKRIACSYRLFVFRTRNSTMKTIVMTSGNRMSPTPRTCVQVTPMMVKKPRKAIGVTDSLRCEVAMGFDHAARKVVVTVLMMFLT